MREILAEAEALAPEIGALRETLHACPELGRREYRTADTVEARLRALGLETVRIGETGVMGTLRGAKSGPVAALRADMDALPVTEETGAPFASRNPGVCHACGHDVHMAAVLGAAEILSRRVGTLTGTVRFLFEPDEEGSGGAAELVRSGCMNGVGAVFGCHVSPELPAGTVGVRYGKFYAAADIFKVTVLGRTAHGAEREKGIDALAAAAEMVTALLRIQEEESEPCVLTIGTFASGEARNILPGRAEMEGIFRTLGPDARERVRGRLEPVLRAIAERHGAGVDLALQESYGGVVNSQAETALLETAAAAVLGPGKVMRLSVPTMTTEDFGVLIDAAAGSFYHVGAGCREPLHSPRFLPENSAAVTAAAVHTAAVLSFLGDGTT